MTSLPLPVLAAAVASASALPVLGWALVARPSGAAVRTHRNLTRDLDLAVSVTPRPSGAGSALVRALTPAGTVARLNRLAGTAGRPAAWPVPRLVVAKLVLPAIAGGLGLLVATARPSLLTWLMVVAVTAVAHVVPELLLYSRGQERRQAINAELADTLDQMTIAVEAGLGFESAMARAARNGKGPLAEELQRTLQDIAVGQPRRDAYLALAGRTGAPDLARFIRAVVQADAYGVSIADVLRTQAQEMRLKRRQRAEEKAMQIPVKVIFPLILCILPTLFIVLLGPAVLGIVAAFSD
ncbi:type II secretion system F family protein [Modestobacter muralis]|uniref:Type II secretion system F family protein n=1 Tax=Modestobacter muralis TaxID=1608614 RepID=A0A6P0H6P6_9ACTN|nr:type II secretion system F family protein [Modestobacter muralis]NEK94122.1 type II secretion system F family protein [Modestobacter muralis]NEN50889.1 type II secretion system F family protein [Modestobacter muralis]